MATSIFDALKRAFKKFGKNSSGSNVETAADQPLMVEPASSVTPNRPTLTVRHGQPDSTTPSPKIRREGAPIKPPTPIKPRSENRPEASNARKSPPHVPAKARNEKVAKEPWQLKLGSNPKLNASLQTSRQNHKNLQLKISGIDCQPLHRGGDENARELVMGIDFGTSSVKVVVGDRAAGKAYAVPFMACDGVVRYLLPSRLHESDNAFSLSTGKQLHRDLKLSLLASGNADEAQQRAVVFLALAIRHARAWLFSEKAEIYNGTKVLWKLVVGIPSENIHESDYAQSEVVQRFTLISHAAWLISGHPSKTLDTALSAKAIVRANEIALGAPINGPVEDVVVEVIPELSAQIFGFLKSNQFDRQGNKVFAVADVGAGTSRFRTVQGYPRSRTMELQFYTNHVQPYGVMNLHRHRVEWWIDALRKIGSNETLIEELCTVEWPTDRMTSLPESVDEYVSDAKITFQTKTIILT